MRWRLVTKEQDYRLVGGGLVGLAIGYVAYRLGLSIWEVLLVYFVAVIGVHLAAGNKLGEW